MERSPGSSGRARRLRLIPVLCVLAGTDAGAAAQPDKPEEPVVAAPAIRSRVQPRLCRDPRRPERAQLDRIPEPPGSPALPQEVTDAGRALSAHPVIETLPADDPRRLVPLRRKAEFSAEQQREYRHQERALQEQRCQAEERGDEALAAQLLTQQLDLERHEQRWRRQAIELYRMVVDWRHPVAGVQHEQALIELAFLLALDRRGAEARAVAERLLKEHPQSRFVPYAHLVRAESLFDRGTASR